MRPTRVLSPATILLQGKKNFCRLRPPRLMCVRERLWIPPYSGPRTTPASDKAEPACIAWKRADPFDTKQLLRLFDGLAGSGLCRGTSTATASTADLSTDQDDDRGSKRTRLEEQSLARHAAALAMASEHPRGMAGCLDHLPESVKRVVYEGRLQYKMGSTLLHNDVCCERPGASRDTARDTARDDADRLTFLARRVCQHNAFAELRRFRRAHGTNDVPRLSNHSILKCLRVEQERGETHVKLTIYETEVLDSFRSLIQALGSDARAALMHLARNGLSLQNAITICDAVGEIARAMCSASKVEGSDGDDGAAWAQENT